MQTRAASASVALRGRSFRTSDCIAFEPALRTADRGPRTADRGPRTADRRPESASGRVTKLTSGRRAECRLALQRLPQPYADAAFGPRSAVCWPEEALRRSAEPPCGVRSAESEYEALRMAFTVVADRKCSVKCLPQRAADAEIGFGPRHVGPSGLSVAPRARSALRRPRRSGGDSDCGSGRCGRDCCGCCSCMSEYRI